jgi:hypothetical protein
VISNERVMPHATERSVGSPPTCSPRADLEIGAGARDQPAEASGTLRQANTTPFCTGG